jgi:hypothetical protein
MWLLWFLYSQWKEGAFQGMDNLFAAKSVPSRSLDSPHPASGDASPPKPAYTFSRLGLWVAPHSTPANTPQDSAGALNSTAATQPDSASPSPRPELDHSPKSRTEETPAASPSPQPDLDHGSNLKTEGTPAGSASLSPQPDLDHTTNLKMEENPAARADVRPAQEQPSQTADRPETVVQPAENEPAAGEGQPAKSARINQDQADTTPKTPGITDSIQSPQSEKTAQAVQPTPSVGSTETGAKKQSSNGFSSTSEEQSLKNMVWDYMRTVASNDDSTQERFFAVQVNFYGKGLLSPSGVRASLQRYRHQWPVRNWEPQGEPEFPKGLHSEHAELYEVLQPFVWTVANGSERKRGSATLYIRARKNDKGEFLIIRIEQRHP